jgi:hypothetical protein
MDFVLVIVCAVVTVLEFMRETLIWPEEGDSIVLHRRIFSLTCSLCVQSFLEKMTARLLM